MAKKSKLSRPAKQRRFPAWIVIIAVILVVCIAAALLWQPVVIRFFPELALSIAVANTAAQISSRLNTPLVNCVSQAAGYISNGSMDAKLALSGFLTDSSYRLTSASDPANRMQTSSYSISVFGLDTELTTYLDADCAVFSSNLLGGENYGITFSTYGSDLEAAGFDKSLNADTLAALNDYVAELDAVYASTIARAGSMELPNIEAPDWMRTVLAYLEDLNFTSSDLIVKLDGADTSCAAISTTMTSRYAATMFLEALETVSSNVWLASSLYSDAENEDTPELQEKLEYYRDNTEGTVTLTAIIHDAALVGVDLEWKFTANHGDMDLNDTEVLTLDLGAKPSAGSWTLELQQAKGISLTSATYVLSFPNTDHYVLTEVKSENGASTQTGLALRWDEGTGLVTLEMSKTSDSSTLTASTSGTILRTNSEVSVNIAGLYDFLKIATLPDFLQGIDLGLVSDASVVAVFSADTDITKPDYVNLDQWTIPWFLDLFL